MIQVLIGSVLISIIHALIPNHWLPIIAISKSSNWSGRFSLFVALIAGLSHIISSFVIGFIIGVIGIKLSENFSQFTELLSSILLIAVGLVFIIMQLIKKEHNHLNLDKINKKAKKSDWAIVVSLCVVMFFTPCLEIEAYYFQASKFGWVGIFLVSIVYMLITLSFMGTIVYLGAKGLAKVKSHFIEHYNHLLSGIVLIALGIISLFVEF